MMKKKNRWSAIALALSFICILLLFASCSPDYRPYVLNFDSEWKFNTNAEATDANANTFRLTAKNSFNKILSAKQKTIKASKNEIFIVISCTAKISDGYWQGFEEFQLSSGADISSFDPKLTKKLNGSDIFASSTTEQTDFKILF